MKERFDLHAEVRVLVALARRRASSEDRAGSCVDFNSDGIRCRAIISVVRRYLMGGAGGLLALMASVYLSSTGCNEPIGTNYGNPSLLGRPNLPGDGGAEPLLCTGDASVASTFDGGCPTFATDIFPYIRSEGKWKCADATCHGGTTAPSIDGKDPAACLATLKAITVGGKGYIVSGTTGAVESTILCNLQGGCGSTMPKPPGTNPTQSELCMLTAWLECGAR
jgi:hypothetical protein